MPSPRTRSISGDAQRRARLSRLLALVLRHRPGEVGLTLDAGGFAPVDVVAQALATQRGWETLTSADLLALVAADPRRYEVRGGRIRARYGHTIQVEEPGEPAMPPEWLYYGAAPNALAPIGADGLRPTDRQHVHMSTMPGAALEVGRRHAPDAVVVVVLARTAHAAGIVFRRAGQGLFLTDHVPPAFLLLPAPDDGASPGGYVVGGRPSGASSTREKWITDTSSSRAIDRP
jgi:putative RNA 2'-phosphotransferase